MSEGANIVVHHHSAPPSPYLRHVHRFAWAMTTDGRTIAVCYGCGARA